MRLVRYWNGKWGIEQGHCYTDDNILWLIYFYIGLGVPNVLQSQQNGLHPYLIVTYLKHPMQQQCIHHKGDIWVWNVWGRSTGQSTRSCVKAWSLLSFNSPFFWCPVFRCCIRYWESFFMYWTSFVLQIPWKFWFKAALYVADYFHRNWCKCFFLLGYSWLYSTDLRVGAWQGLKIIFPASLFVLMTAVAARLAWKGEG